MFFRFTFGIFYSVFWLISLIPFPLMYLISDFFYFLLYRVIGYRKKVAYSNLKKAFPQKSEAEIQAILSKFYHHLCDMFVEFFKSLSMSKADFNERMTLLNPETLTEVDKTGKGHLFLGTHYGNFEYMLCQVDILSKMKCYGVYSPLKNAFFEALIVKSRQKWGGGLIPMRNAIKNASEKLDEGAIIGFMCDQSPSRRKQLYFSTFLGQITAVHDRFAHLALQKAVDVYFMDVRKVKRGFYTFEIIKLPTEKFLPYSEHNAQLFTDFHVNYLSNIIQEKPEFWLWTHRRWKHSPEEGDIISNQ